MHEKLRELTDKIYQEGIARANAEADQIIREASDKSAKMIESAKKEAGAILEDAKKKSGELRKNTISELQLAFRQAASNLKQETETMILARSLDEPVKESFRDRDFLNQLLLSMVGKWDPEQTGNGVDIWLPEERVQEVQDFLKQRAAHLLDKGIHLMPSDKLEKGFEIGPSGGGYKISITDRDFETYLKGFLRPHLSRLLFEDDK